MISLSKGWPGALAALLAGALVTLSLAPFNIWPLGLLSTALLYGLLAECSPRQAIARGWWYGLGLFGSGASWVYVSIHEFGYAPLPLAAILTLAWSAGLGLLMSLSAFVYCRWIKDRAISASWASNALGFACIFVLGEWLRNWLLTGFPWLYLGYAHIDTPLAGWGPIGGVFGISFIVAYSGAVLAQCYQHRQWRSYHLAAVGCLWLAGALFNNVDWVVAADRAPIKVAMVQANISQHDKWQRDQYQPTLALYEQLSAPLWAEHDLVIWPEAAVPGYYQQARGFLRDISKQAARNNSSLITGIPYIERSAETKQVFNSIMAFDSAGQSVYFKQRLVPFGEYVPLEQWLRGLIQFFDLAMSSFTAGNSQQAPLVANGITLAPFICYEIAYPELVSKWLPEADFIITISNDAWFGRSIGPLQHLQMAQMRALEGGRYLLRSTGSGVSAIIDQRGHITVRGGQFSREIISGQARIFSGATPFARWGSWPVIGLCLLIAIGLSPIPAKMRRRR